MARKPAPTSSLAKLLDDTSRPMYVVDYERRIAYCNPALAKWLDLERERIVGRMVEYHSESTGTAASDRDAGAPLTDLCPPPQALGGAACAGTISCVLRDGRLVHRHAEFLPLPSRAGEERPATLVLLANRDMSAQEVESGWSGDPSADELHRTIRQFRRAQATHFAIESLLGDSLAMCKVRAQVAAAAHSGANTLIVGARGSGRRHIARAIHYQSAGDAPAKLVPLDCEVLSDNLLRRALDALQSANAQSQQRGTLLLENLEKLSTGHQSQLSMAIRDGALPARVVATVHRGRSSRSTGHGADSGADDETAPTIDAALLDAISTITIDVPRLVDRLEDLPVLAQCFLEACNRGSGKQVGAVHADALELLTLHSWPGELTELRGVIAAAHRHCTSDEIRPADLPAVVHHAQRAAAFVRRPPERIVLDEFLADIEKEVISRALTQAGGNKSGAAELLGMTRPRLYRRLVQLGLISAIPSDSESAGPEFIEQDPTDQSL